MEGLPEGSGEGSPARPRRVRSDGGRADGAGYTGSCAGNKSFASREIFRRKKDSRFPFCCPARGSLLVSLIPVSRSYFVSLFANTHAYLTCIFFCVRFSSFIHTYTLTNTYIDTYLHRHVYAYTHIYCKYISPCKTLKLFMNTCKHTYTHVYSSLLNIIHTFIDRHVYLACIFCVRLYDRVIQPHYI